MEIHADETINQFVTRLEGEANERMTLATTIRRMMMIAEPTTVKLTGGTSTGIVKRTPRKKKGAKTLGLANHIAEVLRASSVPLTQPQIRDGLIAKGVAINPKNPLSAISTAMSRKEGSLFKRGENFQWFLVGKSYSPES